MKKSMLRLLNILLALAIVCSTMCAMPLSASAADSGTCGENLTWTYDNGTLTISGTGEMEDYDYSRNSPWYSYQDKITTVIICDGATRIGTEAFYECSSLTDITIPESVKNIGFLAFGGCISLTDIKIPDGITNIEGSVFYGCSSLTDITIPDGVTSIGGSMFYGCISLTDIAVPEGVTNIGNYAFKGCTSLENITIPDGVTNIGDCAFQNCTSLTHITIPKSVTNIGKNTFSGCENLKSVYTEILEKPEGWNNIGIDNNNITWGAYIQNDIFYQFFENGEARVRKCLGNPDTIDIPKQVLDYTITAIDEYAFADCTSLRNITIPDGVKSIGEHAFDNTAYYNEPANWTGNAIYIGNYLIKHGAESDGAYIIRYGTKTIADGAFRECTSLQAVTIPGSVTNIGKYVFSGCTSLKKIYILNGVTNIGDFAFNGCTSIKSIELPNSVTGIGKYAFSGCTSLTYINIPKDLTSIGKNAFGGCENLKSIFAEMPSMPDGWEDLGIDNSIISFSTIIHNEIVYQFSENGEARVYKYLGDAKTVDIPKQILNYTVTAIADYAFAECASLTNVTIPDGVKSIGSFAFNRCLSLTEITIPNSVTSMGSNVFEYCLSLKSIELPDGLTSIEPFSFGYCASLTNVTIPEGVTSIGRYAFYCCESFTAITIPDGVTSIETYSFNECKKLQDIVIPDSVTSIEFEAFNNTAYYNNPDNWSENVLYISNHLIQANTSLEGAYSVRAGTKSIAEQAFYYCQLLTDISLPSGVTSVGYYAFAWCKSLKNITISDSVTSIGSHAFEGCSSLTGITIPNSVTSIGSWAFAGCTSITKITIPNSVTEIEYTTFASCPSLKKVIIPDSVTSINYAAFYLSDKCTIYGSNGSYAQEYAKVNNIPFVAGTTVGDKLFIDIVPNEWYVSAVQYAVDNGLFFGVSDCEFAPNEAMNRAMLVTVLWRLEGKPEVSAENKFTDVPAGEWYTQAILWASENGVVYGTGENEFSPMDNITREQMAAILYRYAEKKGYDLTACTDLNTFPDGESASPYARGALSWACGSGLIFGSEGKLLPQDGATRAQVAAILMRYTEKIVQK